MDETTQKRPKRKRKYCSKDTQCIPIISATMAAMLTEGKSVEEVECLALFVSALANDLLLIAAMRNKKDLLFDDIELI